MGKYKLTYLCTLVGNTKFSTITNLPSGSPFYLSYIKNLVPICTICLAIQSAGPLINRTTLATPQREELIHKPRGKCHAGERHHAQVCGYRCASSPCVPDLSAELWDIRTIFLTEEQSSLKPKADHRSSSSAVS